MEQIYHITTKGEWEVATKQGYYEAASLESEGFIHCSKADQVAGVLERYYQGKVKLLKLVINPDKLTSKLQFDFSPSVGETFPHIYGYINLDAIEAVIDLENDL
jgi:uncharacterized protein (DUF952 family)